MTTDKELLEMAAKASGARWTDYSNRTPDHLISLHSDGVWRSWNPLEDDCDAFRLAVKLNIQVTPRTDGKSEACCNYYFIEENGDDPYAATRRAIVRAAAEIGKGMERNVE